MGKDVQDGSLSPDSVDSAQVKSGSMPTVRLIHTPFEQGELIGGRYRIERILAEGGMGIIVAARHLELEETVAIKFLKEEFASKPEIVGRFAREAKAAAKIKCEYTATVHDVGISVERGPYIVMEYLEGEDLESVLQADGRLPFARATELMMQAGEAIAVAHANGIIHRDIKPANLFLVKSSHGVPFVKVLDFGVSKTALTGNVFGGTISLVKTQSLVGSPIYMSPEQLRGGNTEVGFASDVWSLGAVLYELITGTTAFTGSSITELCASVLETEPYPMADRVPDVPSGLADAIMKCLQKDPRKRWQSVAELVVALAPYAPKRACMSVDRVVAVSKTAGLLPADFTAPTTIAPPASSSAIPLAPGSFQPVVRPNTLVDTQTEGAPAISTEDVDTAGVDASVRPQSTRAKVVGLGLLGAAALMGMLYFLRLAATAPEASNTTAAATAPPPTAVAATTAAATPTAPPSPVVINEPRPSALPSTAGAQPTTPRATATPFAQAPWRPTAQPSRAPLGAPSVKPSAAVSAPPSQPATATTEQVRSAIDDRK
jgi:eukaryotic-like serine/threonine-protein kinase